MKSIVVKNKNSVSVYVSAFLSEYNDETKEWYEVKQTEDEMYQSCYESLINDIKRKEFEKSLIWLLQNHLGERMMSNWTNIHIRLDYSDSQHSEMNIGNNENIQLKEMKLEFPDE